MNDKENPKRVFRKIFQLDNHYYRVNNSKIRTGDWYYFKGTHGINPSVNKRKSNELLGNGCFKIIGSTQKLNGVELLNIVDLEEAIYGYSMNRRTGVKYPCDNNRKTSEYEDGFIKGFNMGFKTHQELVNEIKR